MTGSPDAGSANTGSGRHAGGGPGIAPEAERLLYTPDEAAGLLSVPVSWLRRKAAARQVPCTFVGKHLRFSQADLTTIVEDGHQPPCNRRQ